jgi:ssDNA thymidine ADP-ribosyltransferase, DarT
MTYDEIEELHYITPAENLGSILEVGILCHDKAKRIKHASVAMQEVQDRRAAVILPNKRGLHSYVNMYINARNAMMYVRRDGHQKLCVIRVDKRVILHDEAIVTDQNAAKSAVRFSSGVPGLKRIDGNRVFATWWKHDDPLETERHRAAMCAEVLIPDSVDPGYLNGVYVSCPETKAWLLEGFPNLPVLVKPNLFFR